MTDPIDRITDRLDEAAARLRTGDLEAHEAAGLIDECARLAAEAAAELDRRIRDSGDPVGRLSDDQLPLPADAGHA
jgi:hypothetical protein